MTRHFIPSILDNRRENIAPLPRSPATEELAGRLSSHLAMIRESHETSPECDVNRAIARTRPLYAKTFRLLPPPQFLCQIIRRPPAVLSLHPQSIRKCSGANSFPLEVLSFVV